MKLLLPYQRELFADRSPVQLCEKARRIGMTLTVGIRAVVEAARSDAGNNTYYTSYNQDLAKEFISEAGKFAKSLHDTSFKTGEEIFSDIDPNGEPRDILAHTIKFATGHKIVALSSSPRNLRGIRGRLVLDEVAFIDDLPELLKAAMATLIWGGRVTIISTHNGVENPFNQLVQDVHSGKLPYKLFRTTFDDAISQGLFKRVAVVTGQAYSGAAEQKWRQGIIDLYGESSDEELFCVPARGGGVYLPYGLTDPAMREEYVVKRFKVEDAFVHRPIAEQNSVVDAWLEELQQSAIRHLSPRHATFVGEDFGRRSDITAIAIGQTLQTLELAVPLLVELRNVPFAAQERLVKGLIKRLPRFSGAAVDSTGNGGALAESLLQDWGEALVRMVGSAPLGWQSWYPAQLPKLKSAFEDKQIFVPKDADVRTDLAAFRTVDGKPALPSTRTRAKTPEASKAEYRHGDAGVAIALVHYASQHGGDAGAYTPIGPKTGYFGGTGAW